MAKKDQPDKPKRLQQLLQAYRITKKSDPRIGLILLGVFLLAALVVGGIGSLYDPVIGVMLGLPAGLLAAMFVFGRRAEKAAYAQVEGQPGAAAASLGMLRKGWEVKPGVAFTKNQDIVHRVVGRPGIVLVGEGNPNRVRNLLVVEKKKHARMVDEVPIFDIVAGEGEGEVPIKKLPRHIMKLPRSLRPADVTDVLQRLRALDAMRPQAPIPKGPMPQSAKAARQMMRGQSMRGR
jgi:hypothetical protein